MFLSKYIDDIYIKILYSNYDINYLNNLDENNFFQVYNFLKQKGFYYLDDIILNYLEIFTFDYHKIEQALNIIKVSLGDNYIEIIGNNMSIIDKIIDIMID